MQKDNFIVITGAPGTGKSSLLKIFEEEGFKVVGEPAREILSEQRKINGKGISEINNELFRDLILSRSINKYLTTEVDDSYVIFDRGVLDTAAYSELFNLSPDVDVNAGENYKVNKIVFIAPPWKEIYVNDEERKMSFEATLPFHESLKKYYSELNYELVELPLSDVRDRIKFIKVKLGLL